jgi:hypothetical protein
MALETTNFTCKVGRLDVNLSKQVLDFGNNFKVSC